MDLDADSNVYAQALANKRRKLAHTTEEEENPTSKGCSLRPMLKIPLPPNVSLHALAVPPASPHVFIGASDGFTRKYSLPDSLHRNARGDARSLSLAQAVGHQQKQPVLLGYWDNPDAVISSEDALEERNATKISHGPRNSINLEHPSTVYSLAVQDEEIFGLSGTKNGVINLFSIRHDEGHIRHTFQASVDPKKGHKSNCPVGVLALDQKQKSFVSGGWDGRVISWDLDSGKILRTFDHGYTQITSLSFLPIAAMRTRNSGSSPDGEHNETQQDAAVDQDVTKSGLVNSTSSGKREGSYDPLFDADAEEDADGASTDDGGSQIVASGLGANSLSLPTKSANFERQVRPVLPDIMDDSLPALSSDLLLGSMADGRALVWDRRIKVAPVRSLELGSGTPRWAAAATWSEDGNSIFVGRRDATVDIYDIRGDAKSQYSFALPPDSGPVAAVSNMPDRTSLLIGSWDCLRILDLRPDSSPNKSPQFRIASPFYGSPIANMHLDRCYNHVYVAFGSRGFIGGKESSCGLQVYAIEKLKR